MAVTIVLGSKPFHLQVFVDDKQVGYLSSILVGVTVTPSSQSAVFKFISSDPLEPHIQENKDLLRQALPWATIE